MRWLKYLLLVSSCMGALGFFLPFRYTGARAESAYSLVGQLEDDWSMCDAPETRRLDLPPEECRHANIGPDGELTGKAPSHYAYPPFFFLSCVVTAALAVLAIVRRRLGGFVALVTVLASLGALGGPLREARHHHALGWGAALLAISGGLALVIGIIATVWTEPLRPRAPRKPPPQLPEARLLSG